MKIIEMIQRSEDGGHPLPRDAANSAGIGHGEGVLIVSKRDLIGLLYRAREFMGETVDPGNRLQFGIFANTMQLIDNVLATDDYVDRTNLPDEPFIAIEREEAAKKERELARELKKKPKLH